MSWVTDILAQGQQVVDAAAQLKDATQAGFGGGDPPPSASSPSSGTNTKAGSVDALVAGTGFKPIYAVAFIFVALIGLVLFLKK